MRRYDFLKHLKLHPVEFHDITVTYPKPVLLEVLDRMHDVPIFKAAAYTKFDYLGWWPLVSPTGLLMFGDVEFDLSAGTLKVGNCASLCRRQRKPAHVSTCTARWLQARLSAVCMARQVSRSGPAPFSAPFRAEPSLFVGGLCAQITGMSEVRALAMAQEIIVFTTLPEMGTPSSFFTPKMGHDVIDFVCLGQARVKNM